MYFKCRCIILLCSLFVFAQFFRPTIAQEKPSHDRKVVCYIASWATFRNPYPFSPRNIDPSLCTHLIYEFASLKNDTQDAIVPKNKYTDLREDYGLAGYHQVTSYKNQNPHLKVLLCIGGWVEGSINYSILAGNNAKRKKFVRSVVEYLGKYNFDGLDIFWQWPGQRGGTEEDKSNFIKLLKDLKEGFADDKYLLTVYLGVATTTIQVGYDLPLIGSIVDFVHIYAHGFNNPWAKKFGVNSPLDSNNGYNVKSVVNYYLENGVPAKKLIIILPTYGFGYINTDTYGNADGMTGLYQEDKGYLTYHEICSYLSNSSSGWTETWDNDTSTPVAVNGNSKISYENQKSMKIKAKFAYETKLGGAGVWHMDTDDFMGQCKLPGYGVVENISKFPLLKAINMAFKNCYDDDLKSTTNDVEIENINVSVNIDQF